MAFSSILGEAQIVINANTDKLRSGLGKAKREVKTGTDQMAGAFSKLRVGILAIATAIAAIGTASLRATAELETMRVAFESMVGDVTKANALLDQLKEFSAKTPFQLENIAGAARQLLAAGVAAEDVTNELKVLGDIAAGANIPLNDMASIFAKIRNKGKAFTEELLQLSDRGIPIISVLAEKLQITKEEVFDLASKGKLSFDIMRQAMEDMSGKGGIFFDQMSKQSETLSGKWSTLKDNVFLLAASIGDVLAPIAKGLIDIMITLVQWTTSAVNAFKDFIGLGDQAADTTQKVTNPQAAQFGRGGGGGGAFQAAFQEFQDKNKVNETTQSIREVKTEIKAVKEEVNQTEDAWERYRNQMSDSLEATKVKSRDTANTMQSAFGNAFSAIGSQISGASPILGAFLSPILGAVGTKFGSSIGGMFNQSVPQRALGGPINRPTLVGERGPELFIPGQAGTVVSNKNMGGNGVVVNQNINVTPDAPRVFKEQLMAHMPLIKRSAIAGVAEAQNRKGGRL